MMKVDPSKVADSAENYLYGFSFYKKGFEGLRGLIKSERIKVSIKKIDDFEKEILKLENRIEALAMRRAKEAVKLEEAILSNLEIVRPYLEPSEYKDLLG